MKVLIVEDGKDKRHNIRKVIQKLGVNDIDIAKTYFSARNKIINLKKAYNLIILDMFLPDAEDDNELRGLAGKDLIFDMKNQSILTPILVVTQYTEYTNNTLFDGKRGNKNPAMMENKAFGNPLDENREKSYDCTYFEGLHEYLVSEISTYLGIVFYSNQFKTWEDNLEFLINKVKEKIES